MKKKTKRRISMDDHRRAVGGGCTQQQYAKRLDITETEAKRLLSILKTVPVLTIDSDGKIRWLP